MIKFCAIALLIVFTCTKAFAQVVPNCNNNIKGQVLEQGSNHFVEYTAVYIKELNKGLNTDEKGEFEFSDICKGEYTLVISHIGCNDTSIHIDVINKTNKIKIYLQHKEHHLIEITIAENKKELVTTYKVDELSIKQLEQSSGFSLGKMLEQINGVTTLNTGSSVSKPMIHGMHSNRVLILNNGVRLESQQWGSDHAPEIDPFTAQKITVVQGANSVQYGSDAIAGVILVEPKELRDSAGIDGELTMIGSSNGRVGNVAGLLNVKPTNKLPLSFRVQGSGKQGGNQFAPNYYLKNTGVKEYNFSAAAAWIKSRYQIDLFYSQYNSQIGIFSGSHIGNLTDLNYVLSQQRPLDTADFSYAIDRPYQFVNHQLVKAKLLYKLTNTTKLNLQVARQYNLRQEFDKHRSLTAIRNNTNYPESNYELSSNSVESNVEHQFSVKATSKVGVMLNQQANSNGEVSRIFIPNYSATTTGAFALQHFYLRKAIIEAGVRYDSKNIRTYELDNNGAVVSRYRNFASPSATVGSSFTISKYCNANINAGLAWRAPAINELYSEGLHHGVAAMEFGNTNLKAETAYNLSTVFSYQLPKKIKIDVAPYHYLINNYIYLQPTQPPTLTIRGAFPTFYQQQANVTIAGIDASCNYYITKAFVLETKASIVRAHNKTINNYLIGMPADRATMGLNCFFKESNTWKEPFVKLQYSYVNKQWRVPYSVDYMASPSAYSLLSLDAGTTIKIKRQQLKLGLSVSNALNTVYRDYLNRFRYYADDIGRNITIRVKYIF